LKEWDLQNREGERHCGTEELFTFAKGITKRLKQVSKCNKMGTLK
jgi:hypothetical protein